MHRHKQIYHTYACTHTHTHADVPTRTHTHTHTDRQHAPQTFNRLPIIMTRPFVSGVHLCGFFAEGELRMYQSSVLSQRGNTITDGLQKSFQL